MLVSHGLLVNTSLDAYCLVRDTVDMTLIPFSMLNELHADRVRDIEASLRPRARTSTSLRRRFVRRMSALPSADGEALPLPTRLG